MNPGVVDGMSEDEIRARYPDEWEKKKVEVSVLPWRLGVG
jgi:broad specificity phosphatase PhoE